MTEANGRDESDLAAATSSSRVISGALGGESK
jgi:hypothetical protein